MSGPRAFAISYGSGECWSKSTTRSSVTCGTVSRILSTCTQTQAASLLLDLPLTNRPRRYLVVDLMSGGDLRFHIARKTFTEDAVRFWIAELGCALRYVHGQNIIHRDVKPDNVLLDADGHVHLTDFVSRTAAAGPAACGLAHGANARTRMSPQMWFPASL